jgi:hypothetical protein
MQKLTLLAWILGGLSMLLALAHADETPVADQQIFASAPTVVEVGPATADDLLPTDAPAMTAARDRLTQLTQTGVLTSTQAAALETRMSQLPFRRIGTLGVGLGSPEGLALCAEIDPLQAAGVGGRHILGIQGCASTLLLLSAMSINASYRYDVLIHRNPKTGTIHELSVGGGVGVRHYNGDLIDIHVNGTAIDTFASIEWVAWFSRHLGFMMRLDAGTDYIVDAVEDKGIPFWSTHRLFPVVMLSIGIAF